ncbi:MAG: protein YgfX [Thiolinea sp.]
MIRGDNPFTAELVFKPVPSRLLLVFILLIHVLTLILMAVLPGLPWWAKGLLIVAILASLVFQWILHSDRLAKRRVETLYWRESGGWELSTAAGEHLPVIFCGSSFSSVFVDVLNFRTRPALGRRRFTVILLPDNSDPVQRRYLRMRLGLWRETELQSVKANVLAGKK